MIIFNNPVRKYIKTVLIISMLLIPTLGMTDSINGVELALPQVNTVTLSNGIKVLYVRDDLPQLTIVVSAGLGKLYETKENAGISSVLARTLTLGGSKKYPGRKLHETVDALGGKLSISSSWENMTITIKVLARFHKEAFDVVADLLINPNFQKKYLDNAKSLIAEEIRRSYDDPANIAFEKAREIIFDGSSYGAVATVKSVTGFTLKDISSVWQKHFGAGNLITGVSTSIAYDYVKKLLVEKLSAVRKGEKVEYTVPALDLKRKIHEKKNSLFFYEKDVPQATIVIGTIAPPAAYGGIYSLRVMNFILGGGSFSSRLTREIRVKRGLAYGVQSLVKFRSKTGVFLAYVQTKNEAVSEVISIIEENIKKITTESPTEKEIYWALNSISNSYIFLFETPNDILRNNFDLEYRNLPRDYFDKYLENLSKVTGNDVVKEGKKMLENGIIRVIVGRKDVREKLKKFGPVVILK